MGYVKILVFVMVVLAGPALGQGTAPPAPVLPDFAFLSAGGRIVRAVDVAGRRPVMIVFVDVECEHCQRAVKRMDDSARLYGRVGLYFVSMADEGVLMKFAGRYGSHLKAEWLRDPDGRNMVRFRPVRYPAMYLYSPDKRLLAYEDNVETIFRIERAIRDLRGL